MEIFLKFHFSISISSHFSFTLISRKTSPFFSRKKSEIWHQISSKKNQQFEEGAEPKTKYLRNDF